MMMTDDEQQQRRRYGDDKGAWAPLVLFFCSFYIFIDSTDELLYK